MVQQFTVIMCPLGIAIAMFLRPPQTLLDGPAEDMSARLLRWAAGLLSPQRGARKYQDTGPRKKTPAQRQKSRTKTEARSQAYYRAVRTS